MAPSLGNIVSTPIQVGGDLPIDVPSSPSLSSAPTGALGSVPVKILLSESPLQPEARHSAPPPAQRKLDELDVQVKTTASPQGQALSGEALRAALPSGAKLGDWLGAGPGPKDVKLFGYTLWDRSSSYKDMQSALDDYQHALDQVKNDSKLTSAERQQAMQGLADKLKALDAAIGKYQGGWFNPHKSEVALLGARVKEELQTVESLLQEAQPKGWPEGLPMSQALEMKRFDSSLALGTMGDLARVGFKFESGKVTEQMLKDHAAAAPQWAQDARKYNLTPEQARSYFQARVPINDETTKLPSLRDVELVKLGSGNLNTVYKGVHTFQGSSGSTPAVFKPLSTLDVDKLRDVGAVGKSGIDPNNPRLEGRNIASYNVDQLLGLNITPQSELVEINGQLYIAMEMAPGVSPRMGFGKESIELQLSTKDYERIRDDKGQRDEFCKAHGFQKVELLGDGVVRGTVKEPGANDVAVEFNVKDPGFQKALIQLQWLDALNGQVDRHVHNYMVKFDSSGKFEQLKGIDNDLAFGKEFLLKPGKVVGHNMNLPKIVDEGLALRFEAMKPEQLTKALEGHVSPDEIKAAVARLDIIKSHIAGLRQSGGVISSDEEWSGEKAQKLLGLDGMSRREELAKQIKEPPPGLDKKGLRNLHEDYGKIGREMEYGNYVSRDIKNVTNPDDRGPRVQYRELRS